MLIQRRPTTLSILTYYTKLVYRVFVKVQRPALGFRRYKPAANPSPRSSRLHPTLFQRTLWSCCTKLQAAVTPSINHGNKYSTTDHQASQQQKKQG